MCECDQLTQKGDDLNHLEEDKWVQRVQKGDRDAFEKIFRIYYKRLQGFAYSFVKQRQEAEDIVQSVFLKIWSQRKNWNPSGKLKHYLFTAVKNEALNILRHKKIVKETEDEVAHLFKELQNTSDSYSFSDVKQLKKDIQSGINKLPPRCRQIFVLNRRSGLTYTEIADFLDISINTVNTQMGRALQALRKHLSNYLYLMTLSIGFLMRLMD